MLEEARQRPENRDEGSVGRVRTGVPPIRALSTRSISTEDSKRYRSFVLSQPHHVNLDGLGSVHSISRNTHIVP